MSFPGLCQSPLLVFSHTNPRAFIIFTTLFLVAASPSEVCPPKTVELRVGFLDLTSAAFAVIQYAPQIYTTWKLKLVGALSIPMMCIQTPRAVLMVTNLAIQCVPSRLLTLQRTAVSVE